MYPRKSPGEFDVLNLKFSKIYVTKEESRKEAAGQGVKEQTVKHVK